jgi:hypothetical protein
MIDINKKYRTRDGREVRIYATDGIMPRPIHGAVKSSYDSTWHSFQWHEDGRLVHNVLAVDLSDLIEVRPRHKRTVWLIVWSSNFIQVMKTPEWQISTSGRSGEMPYACIKIELDYEEGEGL